jgi:uncharacterized tellurite resistance protein B-like protein
MLAIIRNIIEGKSGKGRETSRDLEQKKHIAAGVLLLEAAHIDNDCSGDEMEHIVATLREKFDLTEQCVAELLELVRADRAQAIDLWQFTNQINRHFSLAEKNAVMEDVWRIIFVDGQLQKHEDHFAHKLANLLRLSHKQMIEAKQRARAQMAER